MFGTFSYNTKLYAGVGLREKAVVQFSPITRYRVELRSRAGVLLHYLDGWEKDAPWTEALDDPDELTLRFSPDHDAIAAGDMKFANEVWLYDGAGNLLRQFVIVKSKYKQKKGQRTFEIRCKGALYFLEREAVTTYEPEVNLPIRDHVTALLAFQDSASPITIGTIHPTIANDLVSLSKVRNSNILAILKKLQQANVGGFISVDNKRQLNWQRLDASWATELVSLRGDMVEYEEEADFEVYANRVRYIGGLIVSGGQLIPLTLASPGYVEDTVSQATYGGIFSVTITDKTITELDMLTAKANRELDLRVNGQLTHKVAMFDLAQQQHDISASVLRHPDYIFPGGAIRIAPPQGAASTAPFNQSFLKVSRNLGDPSSVKVEIGLTKKKNPFRRLGEKLEAGDDVDDAISQDIEDATYLTLTDTPGDYVGDAGKYLRVNSGQSGIIHVDPDTDHSHAHEHELEEHEHDVPAFTDLTDTPGSFGGAGQLMQVNVEATALSGFSIGAAGQIIVANSSEVALEWVDFPGIAFVTAGAKAGLGTPDVIALGLITAGGDNRLMIWDADAVVSQINGDWRDVNSYGKTAT